MVMSVVSMAMIVFMSSYEPEYSDYSSSKNYKNHFQPLKTTFVELGHNDL